MLRRLFCQLSVDEGEGEGRVVKVDQDARQEEEAWRGRDRVSFELTDEDLQALRFKRRTGSNTSLSSTSTLPPTHEVDEEFLLWQEDHPCALDNFDDLLEYLSGKRLALFLDYDGTLTPIVNNPEEAFLSEKTRAVIQAAARLFPVAIISGRGREKVQNFVNLRELFYAGSHGMDILGPQIGPSGDGTQREPFSFQAAAEFKSTIDTIHKQLTEALKTIPGATVEHNIFCVSAHFRNCAPSSWQKVVSAVDSTAKQHPNVRVTRGRKVLEIRPQVEWNKGHALNQLLEAMDLKRPKDVIAMYIGDDTTDEDAFKLLRDFDLGVGILVTTKVKATEAHYCLHDPVAVQQLLARLVKFGLGPENGWRNRSSCNGWEATSLSNGAHEGPVIQVNGPGRHLTTHEEE